MPTPPLEAFEQKRAALETSVQQAFAEWLANAGTDALSVPWFSSNASRESGARRAAA